MPARALLAVLALSLSTVVMASADDLSDFNDAIETFAAHNRVAIRHLRARNVDLAGAEIGAMRAAWGSVVERFGNDRPQVFRDNPLYVTAFVDVPTRLVGVDMMLMMGRIDLAGAGLDAVRKELSELRRASGVAVLADCILDANAAMDRLAIFRDRPPDWNVASQIAELGTAADAYAGALRHCDAMAPEAVKTLPEFRRLIDGASASVAQIPKALAGRNGDLVLRLLIELRSIDELLAFHYG
jgi:hypothetical protein